MTKLWSRYCTIAASPAVRRQGLDGTEVQSPAATNLVGSKKSLYYQYLTKKNL